MNASTLKNLYEAQLQQDLEPPVHEHVDRRATRCMLRISRALPPGELTEGDHNRIWIWSDLHLGHHETIGFFQRPFPSPRQMDLALFSAWERTVAPHDTIICLGDVTIPALWGPRLKRLRRAPGRKLLVIGNHDTDLRALADAGFATQHRQALYEAEPTLARSLGAGTGDEVEPAAEVRAETPTGDARCRACQGRSSPCGGEPWRPAHSKLPPSRCGGARMAGCGRWSTEPCTSPNRVAGAVGTARRLYPVLAGFLAVALLFPGCEASAWTVATPRG